MPRAGQSADAEIFHREMLPFGGRVAWERGAGTPAGEAYAWMSRSAQSLIASASTHLPRLPKIHFDFVFNASVNAFAFKWDERYFVGVTSGAVFMLELVFSRMLRHRRLLTHAGDATSEAENLPTIAGLMPDADQMLGRGVIPLSPKSDARSRYASHLLDRALLFLVGHEIAHITNGHVDYVQAKSGNGFIAELGWYEEGQKALLERQALEADADCRSVVSAVDTVRLMSTRTAPVIAPWSASRLEAGDLLFDWSFAMNSLFRLFGDVRFTGASLPTVPYPPLPLRRMIATVEAYTIIKATWQPGLVEAAVAAFRRAIFDTETAFAAITGQEVSADGLGDALGPDGHAHVHALMDLLHGELRDRLLPYAYKQPKRQE